MKYLQHNNRKLLTDLLDHPWMEKRSAEYFRWYPKQLNEMREFKMPESPANIKGIYIHVPFCSEICKFCPFSRSLFNQEAHNTYMQALIAEIRLYQQFVKTEQPLEFIYFGGGTPSVLSRNDLQRILEAINAGFPISASTEISMEAHPTHLTPAYIKDVLQAGVNRISTGIQSFQDNILKGLGSTHKAQDSYAAIESLESYMPHYGIDLLYRCKDQSIDNWYADLQTLDQYSQLRHVSCYTLSLEDSRALPGVKADLEMAVLANQFFADRNFRHYASCASGGFDFMAEGYRCKYEYLHWAAPQTEYLGLGPAAFGCFGQSVSINFHMLDNYARTIASGRLPLLSLSTFDRVEAMHRFFVLGLKTLEIDFTVFKSIYNEDAEVLFRKEIDLLIENHLAIAGDNLLRLTQTGRYFVDQVCSLFYSNSQSDIDHQETIDLIAAERRLMRSA